MQSDSEDGILIYPIPDDELEQASSAETQLDSVQTRASVRLQSDAAVAGMSEKAEQPAVITVAMLRAEAYSAKGDSIVVSLQTKYSTAERKYSIPVECFRDLIVDLRRLSGSAPISSADTIESEI